MKTVLFVQPSLQPPGGGNALAAWMLEALRQDYSVTTYTWAPVDVDRINRYCGTSLTPADLDTRQVPRWVRATFDAVPIPLSLLKSSVLMRFARREMARFDLVVSANNEVDFGRPGIQYIHYPAYDRPRPAVDLRWYHRPRFLLHGYYWLCDRLFGVGDAEVLRNRTLVNSNWTGTHFCRRYGATPRTLYPPVSGRFPSVPWDARRNDFICLGRLAPEKDLDTVIDIIGAVRRERPDVHLHVIGSPGARGYYRRIRRRIDAHPDWITLHLDISHDDVRRLISGSRYGLHAMENEHFGMAPAEMITGGCIVWVRDRGGQVEIVGGEPRLLFGSVDEAVSTILAVMARTDEQADLRRHLDGRAPLFSVERFMREIRAVAAEQLASANPSAAGPTPRSAPPSPASLARSEPR